MSERNGLPESWELTTLDEVVAPLRISIHPADRPELPYVGMEHVEPETMRLVGTASTKEMKSNARLFRPGDVLYGRLRPYLNKVYRPNFEGLCSAEFIVLPESLVVDNNYLQYVLNSWPFKEFASHLNAGDRPRVDWDQLKGYAFPLPPLAEQRHIVAAIEEQFSRLDAGVMALERARTNLKRYRTAVLKAAVEGRLTEDWREGNPDVEPASELLERILKERRERWEKDQLAAYEKKGKKPPKDWRSKYKEPVGPDTEELPELPEGWCWASMDSLLEFVTSGSRGWARYYSDRGPAFIRMGNLDHDTVLLDLAQVQRVNPPDGAEGTRTRVRPDDILISITAELGMVALVPSSLGEAYINQHVALARPVEKGMAKYLAWFLVSSSGKRQLESLRRGATKIGLGLDDIRAVGVALPPVAEQNQITVEIERRLSILKEVEAEVEANLKRAARLRQSILKRAFEGKLVPQDPSDEPASELLERVRLERERYASRKKARKKKPGRAGPEEPQTSLF